MRMRRHFNLIAKMFPPAINKTDIPKNVDISIFNFRRNRQFPSTLSSMGMEIITNNRK